MPWTFAHPAAVLPLRSLSPARLSFTALLIGSITPDLGYYVGRFDVATLAHTLLGVFLVCLPTGIALLVLLRKLQQPLCYLFPQPHRNALSLLSLSSPFDSPAVALRVVLSLVIGALTHIVWDSFTHATGWAVTSLSFLHQPVRILPGGSLPLFHALQHMSTVLGIVALTLAYRRWLRRVVPQSHDRGPQTDQWRRVLLLALALVSLATAIPIAYAISAPESGSIRPQVFFFRLVLSATTVFSSALVATSFVVMQRAKDA